MMRERLFANKDKATMQTVISTNVSAEQSRPYLNWWPWMCALFGLVSGVFDVYLFEALGIDMSFGGQKDAAFWIGLYLASSFAVLGFSVGYLLKVRVRLRQNAKVIASQFEALEQSQRALLESQKLAALGKLAACVAHEVRNPLGVIRTSASMLSEDMEPENEGVRIASFICDEVDRLNRFCSALLDFSRPFALEKETLTVEELLAEGEDWGIELCAQHGVDFAMDVEPGLAERALRVDRSLCQQVLINLIKNGAQASAPGGQVCLVGRAAASKLCLEIKDNGPGIDASHETQVFEPFFTTRAKGTGLGLSMSQRIVEAHHGLLEVVPACGLGDGGAGACLRMTLPFMTTQQRGTL